MKPASTPKKFIILFLLLVGPGLILIFLAKSSHHFQSLPYYGVKTTVPAADSQAVDTIYHTVPDFHYISQDNEEISWADFEGDIVVVDFFFTTCPTICPLMSKQMTRLQVMLDDPAFKDVKFLSHTVNPEHDTPEVLKEYAKKQDADLNRWTFVTGEAQDIYKQGFEGYLLSTQEDNLAPGGFLHSSMFVLVDKERHIRGFYDGTSAKEVDDLVDDIKLLLKEDELQKQYK